MDKFTQGKITHGKETLVIKRLCEEELALTFFIFINPILTGVRGLGTPLLMNSAFFTTNFRVM